MTQRLRPLLWPTLALLTSLLVFGVTFFATVHYTDSDPQPALLVSQAILEHGTVQLDAYPAKVALVWRGPKFVRHADHVYYYFPLGGSVFSLPAVWVANHLGYDMGKMVDNYALQNLLSALLCAAWRFLR